MARLRKIGSTLLLALSLASGAAADVITGTIDDWEESSSVITIGDGTNSVSLYWSINTTDRGFFYGSRFTGDSDVAFAAGVTDIGQIADASIYTYENGAIGPHCDPGCDPDQVGDFLVWHNDFNGYYGVLRIDDIVGNTIGATLDGTWWFQTEGSSTFVPEPASALLLASGLVALSLRRRR